MNDPTRKPDPAAKGPNVYYEADIGSGEKSPGEMETEQMIQSIPPLPHPGSRQSGEGNKTPEGEAGRSRG